MDIDIFVDVFYFKLMIHIYILFLICELTPSVGIVVLWTSADFQG